MGGRSKTSPEAIELQQRITKAILLRRLRTSWQDVAEQCGWESAQAAHKVVSKAIKAIPAEEAATYRATATLMYERIMFAIIPKANKGDEKAIDRVIAIESRVSRLCGYDAPQKIAETNPDGTQSAQRASVHFYIPNNGREQTAQGSATQGSTGTGDGSD